MPDLWKMDPSREAGTLSAKLDEAWDRRQQRAAEWNRRLASGEIKPGVSRRTKWFFKALASRSHGKEGQTFSDRRNAMEHEWRTASGVRKASLAWSLNDTFGWHFWAGGLFKARYNCIFIIELLYSVIRYFCIGYRRYISANGSNSREGIAFSLLRQNRT